MKPIGLAGKAGFETFGILMTTLPIPHKLYPAEFRRADLLNKSSVGFDELRSSGLGPRHDDEWFLPLGHTGIGAQRLKPLDIFLGIDRLVNKALAFVDVIGIHAGQVTRSVI